MSAVFREPRARRPGRSRSLAPYLLGVVLFEVSLLAGTHAATFLGRLAPTAAAALPGAEPQLAQWRRSAMAGSHDPARGVRAPRLTLRSATGGTLLAVDGQRCVVIFAPEAAG